MENLSHRQRLLLLAVANMTARRKFPPSILELQFECAMSSTSVVGYNLKRLAEKGLITQETMIARSIVITDVGREWLDELVVPA